MKKYLLIALLAGCICFIGCHKTKSTDFNDLIQISGCYLVGDSMSFQNIPFIPLSCTSVNVISTYWDFGDGSSSPQPSPSHVYTAPGIYTVTNTINGKQFTEKINITNPPLSSPYTANMAGTRQWLVKSSGVIPYPPVNSYPSYDSFQVIIVNSSTIKIPIFASNYPETGTYHLTMNDTVNKVLKFTDCAYIVTTINYYYAADSITYYYTWSETEVTGCSGRESGILSMHTL